ncbi:MAG: ABC transporter ATP-binding protein [Thermoguttaceae bacterium]|nr:ABC transporter ATP-binding protein [Thermoguttaceae bacterium]
MSDVAIRVEKLSKRFILGERVGIKTFRETIQDLFTAPLRRLWKPNGSADEPKVDTDRVIWALKDVSFEVKHGEVLGIIGPNGAGKSTLLKILSRITEPTSGYAEIRGRVGSLLEVGTGFHPELTGRENVYLNGAILGMSRAEIRRKFDDIVSFAGVEKFIDTPVKRYSSGMQVRLAFAVAAHLDPEILIIDEVLAVGDAEFQKRCLGKMNEVARSGRTVLFVSHNLAAVEGLCNVAMRLQSGRLMEFGQPISVIGAYLKGAAELRGEIDLRDFQRPVSSSARFEFVRFLNSRGICSGEVACGEDLTIELGIAVTQAVSCARIAIRFFNSLGQRILTCHSDYQMRRTLRILTSTVCRCSIFECRLVPGDYFLEIQLDDGPRVLDKVSQGIVLRILPKDVYGTGRVIPPHATAWLPRVTWEVQ